MIDNAVILFSTGMVVYIIIRAARLDVITPWYVRLTARRSPRAWAGRSGADQSSGRA